MVNNHDVMKAFILKPSQISIGFQGFVLIIMGIGFLYSVGWIMALVLSLVAVVAMRLFQSQAQIESFQHLDRNQWSVKYKNNSKIHTLSLNKIVDHHFYIVFYFDQKPPSSLVVWSDQLELKQWKNLKAHSKLQ